MLLQDKIGVPKLDREGLNLTTYSIITQIHIIYTPETLAD